MKLVLMRHAEAHDSAERPDRPLTSKGRRDAEKIGQLLRHTGWDWSEVKSSPVLRARETAEIISHQLHAVHHVDPTLQPGVTPERFLDVIDAPYTTSALLCIFHMPDIAQVAAHLLGVHSDRLFFSPGSALALNISERLSTGGIQIFQYQPDYLG